MKRLTSLFIVSIVLSFIFVAGCAQSSYRDSEFINAIIEGNTNINEIFGNIREHPDNYSEMKIDGQNLFNESRIQYDRVQNITPISPDLELAKQYYLNAMWEYEQGGRSLVEGVESYNTTGNYTLTTVLFENASRSMAKGAQYIGDTGNVLPKRFKSSAQNVTAMKFPVSQQSLKVSDNASSPLSDYEFIIFESPVQNVS
ncbi:MAG: hypothetical protein BWY93_00007 [Euryarchaeota archaeon ADurb.BinA087]|nr:MAG: hypothetical protein BWY93_00007 [Euryarchaeota archaeon ADurb.BinA087]